MNMEEQVIHLRECIQLIVDSQAYTFYGDESQQSIQKKIYRDFALAHFMISAAQAQFACEEGRYQDGMAYLKHTEQMITLRKAHFFNKSIAKCRRNYQNELEQ